MKKITNKTIRLNLVLCLIFGITLTMSSCKKTETTYYPSGKIQSIISYKGGKEDGKSKFYFEQPNTLEIEVEMKRGKRNGEFRRYFENGYLDTYCVYENDSIEGLQTMYTANGVKSQEFTYVHGHKNGPRTAYHLNGVVKVQGNYKNDLFDGDWHYFDERGIPVGDGHFENGSGKVNSYDQNGVLARSTSYVNNKKDGAERYYTPQGDVYKEIIFQQDRIVSVETDSLAKR